jgi:hypothetical protein
MVSCVVGASVKVFADDSKLYFKCRLPDDYQVLLDAVNSVFGWASANQLKISLEKCMVLHFASRGQTNPCRSYVINGITLPNVSQAKDLGILFSSTLKFSDHCSAITTKAFQRTNLIFRAFSCRDVNFLASMFKTYVRPLVEYCTPVWSPYLDKDINLIERVQRRFTKRIPQLKNLTYKQRLERLNLETLEKRRLIYDLVQCFKIVYALDNLSFDDFFIFANGRTRGHSKRLFVAHSRIDCRKHFFANRVVRVWNYLPESVVASLSVEVFKRKLACVDISPFLKYDLST